ncbi:amino acid ABC transporter substrate-binding protein [Fervidicella metallireducens AeB]|uniref:Amino acid ABC transporter substrate-binding protein n=1 Tax=Fervidicella metallireducens AeB TaxID=1403537 RepID=A0A017RWY7_9CLOT|nr:ABC transporter substrate-binding protein [Fervidicella metallireducens]EYE88445.1 amino acid ABC transporter substrate-binding protein [Fervidicella metallireducens AeB]
MKKIFVTFLVTVIVLGFIGCSSPKESNQLNSLEKIKKSGILTMGLDDSFPPMEFRDDNNNLQGFDIDLGNEIAKKLGVKAEFITTDFNGIILALTTGKFDMVLSTLSITDERKQTIDFSEPYIMEGIIVAIKGGNSTINNLEDLKGKIIACQMGSTSESAGQKISGIKELKKYDKITEAFHDLSIGRIDAVVVDELVGRYYMSKKSGEYEVLKDKLNDEPVGIGFKKEDVELKEAVQKAIEELKKDGTLSKLSIKWFGVDIYK